MRANVKPRPGSPEAPIRFDMQKDVADPAESADWLKQLPEGKKEAARKPVFKKLPDQTGV